MAKTTRNPLAKSSGLSTNLILSVVVLLVAVLVIGGVLLTNSGNNNQSAAAAVPAGVLHKPDSHMVAEAPGDKVTVVEFLDYQCPACAAYYQNVTQSVEQDYQGQIAFVVRNFPLDMHALAMPAARAAEAAAMQGKYNEMYHALFGNYRSWAVTPDGQDTSKDEQRARAQFDTFARQIGLDLDRFHRDMASQQVTERIEQDKADGEKAGVEGTPTIFINGEKFEPTGESFQDVANQFRRELDKELGR